MESDSDCFMATDCGNNGLVISPDSQSNVVSSRRLLHCHLGRVSGAHYVSNNDGLDHLLDDSG